MNTQQSAVDAQGLIKVYGTTRALDGIDLHIPQGGIIGVLGPNGAGKSTLIRTLTTLSPLDGGTANVAGADVTTAPHRVRQRIGVTGQEAALDNALTGRNNLFIIGRLRGLSPKEAHRRASILLEQFGLTHAADRSVAGYSGGMRRRLDLACSLTVPPRVLFLDEPTTGLDPRSRQDLWDVVKDLADHRTTVILTTQYLEEADHLAHRVVVINRGRIVADDTPQHLKQRTSSVTLVIDFAHADDVIRAQQFLFTQSGEATKTGPTQIMVRLPRGSHAALQALNDIESAGITIRDFDLRKPTLDDVFMALTQPISLTKEGR